MSDSSTKTYVYDNTEVKLTGRQAEKKTETKARGRRAGGSTVKVDTLYEITPAGDGVATWKQWVRMSDLYQIED